MLKLAALSVLLLSVLGNSQEMPSDIHQSSLLPANARYEIVGSQLAARWLFKLDRYTGKISQIVHDKNDDMSWEEMDVEHLPTIGTPTRPRFQLFLSGIAARWMFLLDTDTGATWQLSHFDTKKADGTSEDTYLWHHIPN